MPDYDAHIQASRDDLTERSQLDRLNRAKSRWIEYVRGSAESELIRNKMAIAQAVLLSKWRAEDRALRSSRARPVVCSDCGARHLGHFPTSKAGSSRLCPGCFQNRSMRGLVQEADTSTLGSCPTDGLAFWLSNSLLIPQAL